MPDLPEGLFISTYRDPWQHPMARYAVHRRAKPVVPAKTLAEAKAWVEERYGKQTWERTEVPDGRGTRKEWRPKR